MASDKDNDDFTFCQVSAPTHQIGFDERHVVPGIRNIAIKDEASSHSITESTDQIKVWNNIQPSNATNVKEEKVGSLSFNVISTTPQRGRNEALKPAAEDGAGNSAKDQVERKPPIKKPTARAKVPFEKGYSQVDWLKLTRTHPDLAGLKGQSNKRLISMSEVKQNQTEGAMWTVLKGRVYNISPYMKFHPGGVDMLMKTVGKDCTSLFSILLAPQFFSLFYELLENCSQLGSGYLLSCMINQKVLVAQHILGRIESICWNITNYHVTAFLLPYQRGCRKTSFYTK